MDGLGSIQGESEREREFIAADAQIAIVHRRWQVVAMEVDANLFVCSIWLALCASDPSWCASELAWPGLDWTRLNWTQLNWTG